MCLLMTQKTIYELAVSGPPFRPEFTDHKGAKVIFGFSRAHLYNLTKEGKIRSVCIRKPGAIRGRRLFDCESIRAFLNKHAVGGRAIEKQ